jgi:hypothetical protein
MIKIMLVLKIHWLNSALIEKLIAVHIFCKFLAFHGKRTLMLTLLQNITSDMIASVAYCNLGNAWVVRGMLVVCGAVAYARKSPLHGGVSALHAVFMHGFICLILLDNSLPLSEAFRFSWRWRCRGNLCTLLSLHTFNVRMYFSTLFSNTLNP